MHIECTQTVYTPHIEACNRIVTCLEQRILWMPHSGRQRPRGSHPTVDGPAAPPNLTFTVRLAAETQANVMIDAAVPWFGSTMTFARSGTASLTVKVRVEAPGARPAGCGGSAHEWRVSS
jgi:hypothetical protein